MKTYTSLFVALLFLFIYQFSHAQDSPDTQQLDSYFSTLEEYNKFMGSVAVLEGDQVLFRKATGFINENEQPASPETVYRIGSITKTYTSTLILKLEEKGTIQLSDHLSRFFPEIPNADEITIEHLLYHRSGLKNFTNQQEYSSYYTAETTRQEMLDRFAEYGTNFEPGEKFEYSNTGYVLLGYIIEEATGMSYGEALQEYITKPLGLERTYSGEKIRADISSAKSFSFNNSWTATPQTHMFIPHGAGAIVSTPAEVARFFKALFDGQLISESSLQKMTTLKDGYGMGITQIPFYDKMAWGHNGGIDGFQSTAAYFPEDDLAFSMVGNGVNYSMNDITIGVLSIVFGRDFQIPDFGSEPEQVELSEKDMNMYTGSFSSKDIPLEMEVFIQNGALMAQASGQGAFPLTAFEGSVMKFAPAGITMVFDSLADGKYQAFELQQAGQRFSFERTEE